MDVRRTTGCFSEQAADHEEPEVASGRGLHE